MPPKKKQASQYEAELTPYQYDNRYMIAFWQGRIALYEATGNADKLAFARATLASQIELQPFIDAQSANERIRLKHLKVQENVKDDTRDNKLF